ASTLFIVAMCGLTLGCSRQIVQSTLLIFHPSLESIDVTSFRKNLLSMPFHRLSLLAKWNPISRMSAAPSSASQMAWISTSASECPTAPLGAGRLIPPSQNARPSSSWCTSYPIPTLIFFISLFRRSVIQCTGIRFFQYLTGYTSDVTYRNAFDKIKFLINQVSISGKLGKGQVHCPVHHLYFTEFNCGSSLILNFPQLFIRRAFVNHFVEDRLHLCICL